MRDPIRRITRWARALLDGHRPSKSPAPAPHAPCTTHRAVISAHSIDFVAVRP
ncbi:hypothetical protein [Streptomyces cinnamoneus]|uniref:hypothetical protein n=1 Tax=Streptomyces cinnamoneus TaxID=53446 RepID=UPI00167E7143|nr:hypothetical protein [Streptomyces cinnamoneus]